jgi:hypothetical protein
MTSTASGFSAQITARQGNASGEGYEQGSGETVSPAVTHL